MRIRLSIPDNHLTPEALNAALEATTRTNESMLAAGKMPLAREAIKRGAKWKPEPPGDEHFDLAPTILQRGWGDCDDWAPYEAASLRVTGVDPGARAVVRRSGPKRWHAVVLRSSGQIDDPSRWAGMGKGGRPGVHGMAPELAPRYVASVSPLQPGLVAPRVAINLVPFKGRWAGRVDVPYGNAALASDVLRPDARTALLHALKGAAVVGEAAGAHDDCVLRCAGIHDLLSGDVDPRDVVMGLVEEHPDIVSDTVGFLPALTAAIPMAGGVLNTVSSLFGGKKGAPAAAPAASAPAWPGMAGFGGGRGGGPPGATYYNPFTGAPIIVRF